MFKLYTFSLPFLNRVYFSPHHAVGPITFVLTQGSRLVQFRITLAQNIQKNFLLKKNIYKQINK